LASASFQEKEKKKNTKKKNTIEKKKNAEKGEAYIYSLVSAFGMKRSFCFLFSTFLQR